MSAQWFIEQSCLTFWTLSKTGYSVVKVYVRCMSTSGARSATVTSYQQTIHIYRLAGLYTGIRDVAVTRALLHKFTEHMPAMCWKICRLWSARNEEGFCCYSAGFFYFFYFSICLGYYYCECDLTTFSAL